MNSDDDDNDDNNNNNNTANHRGEELYCLNTMETERHATDEIQYATKSKSTL